MGMRDLAHMDAHPLLCGCPRTLKLVALAYLASCFSCSDSTEYGLIVGRSLRQRIAVNPAALSFLRQDGALACARITCSGCEVHAQVSGVHPPR